jgi:gas vesicle protein
MSKKDWIEVTASMLGGAGIGAAIMYFFDPQLGDERRSECRENIGDAMSATGETLGETWESFSEKARNSGRSLAETAGAWASRTGEYLQSAASDASDQGRRASRAARGYARSARNTASDWMGYNSGPSAGSVAGITAGAVGALALGAGLMFLLDPSQGRRRRALIRDKAVSSAHQAQRYASSTGRHLGNKAQGWAAEARSMASQAGEKIGDAKDAVTKKMGDAKDAVKEKLSGSSTGTGTRQATASTMGTSTGPNCPPGLL